MSEIHKVGPRAGDVFGEFNVTEYVQVIRRRKWYIVFAAVGVLLIATILSVRLPNVYRSQTVILVDPQKVPDSYVTSIVSTNISDRLSTIRQEVMSPSRLARLVDSLGLYKNQRGKMDDQAIIAKMQKAISVEVVTQGGHALSAFQIGYSGQDPVQVAKVTNQLAAAFIEQNLQTREQQSIGTTEFLQNELEKTKQQLEQKDSEMREVKSKFIMDLPDSKQFHVEALDSLRRQAENIQDRISRNQQEKVYLQSIMTTNAPTIDLDSEGVGSTPYDSQIQKLESKLSELSARYGPNYPDVRKVKADLDTLKARAAAEQKNAPQSPAPVVRHAPRNPVVEAQLQKLTDEMQTDQKQLVQVQDQINFHMSKLERIPIFEQKISGMMRDYDILRQHYTGLLDKKLAAEMASNLESRQKGERFVILDPAQVPDRPASPNRPLIVLAGLFGGIFCGVGLAIIMEVTDQTVKNEQDVVEILGRDVLVGVPHVTTKTEKRTKALRLAGAFAATSVVAVALGYVISTVATRLI